MVTQRGARVDGNWPKLDNGSAVRSTRNDLDSCLEGSPMRILVTLLLPGLTIHRLLRARPALAQHNNNDAWARVIEDDRSIKIETDQLEAVIPKINPKQRMTGIEKGTFL